MSREKFRGVETEQPADDPHGAGRQWVLLPREARVRGFRNTLAFRRWCTQRGVVIRTDRKLQWVAPADVDAAIGAMPTRGGRDATDPAVTDAVEALMAAPPSRRRRS